MVSTILSKEINGLGAYGIAQKLYNLNFFHYSFVLIGGVLTFLPLFVENSYMENTPLTQALNSKLFRDASVSLLSL